VKKVKIGNKLVGRGEKVFIIAEAGSNHNGKLEQAKELIKVAAEAKADAIKFQTFRAGKLYVKKAGSADYLKTSKSIFEIIKKLECPTNGFPNSMNIAAKQVLFFYQHHTTRSQLIN